MEFITLLLKIIVALIFTVFAIHLSLRLGGSKLQAMQNGKYMKIVERVAVSKDNSLLVVKFGDKAYVLASAQGKVDILKELEMEEIKMLEEAHKLSQYKGFNDIIKNFKKREE